jgi:hypothetical protein
VAGAYCGAPPRPETGKGELSRIGRPAVKTCEDPQTVATESFGPTRKGHVGADTPAPAVTGLSAVFQRRYLPDVCQFTAGSVGVGSAPQSRSRRSLALAPSSFVNDLDWSDEFLGVPLRPSRPRETRHGSLLTWLASLRVLGAPPTDRRIAGGHQTAVAGPDHYPVGTRAELWRRLESHEITAAEFLRGRKRLEAEGERAVWGLPPRQRAAPRSFERHVTVRY